VEEASFLRSSSALFRSKKKKKKKRKKEKEIKKARVGALVWIESSLFCIRTLS
jgi:hypothetical protein